MIRLFVAIPIGGETADALTRLQAGVPGARWSPLENLHVTLRFAGQVSAPAANDLAAELEGVRVAPFDLEFGGVGAFEEGIRPTSLWVGVRPNAFLSSLRSRCDAAVRRVGLKRDPRTWKPHVTVAYFGGLEVSRIGAWVQSNNLTSIPCCPVRSFGLFSSWRGSAGAKYRLEQTYRLS